MKRPRAICRIQWGRVIPGGVERTLTTASNNRPGFLLFGTRRIQRRIPGTPCDLLTDVLLPLNIQTDGSGRFSLKIPVPPFLGRVSTRREPSSARDRSCRWS